MHRRGFLSLCAAGSMAGCSLPGSSNHQAARTDATSVTDQSEEPYRLRLTLGFELPAGEYTTTVLSPTETETLAIDATVNRGTLDIWTIAEEDFEAYETGEEVHSVDGLSATGVIAGTTLVGEIEPGDHRIVFDNTPAFGSGPGGTAAGNARLVRRLMPAAFFDFKQTLERNDITYEEVGASEDRAWWLVGYQQGETQSQAETASDMQDILLAYSNVVPDESRAPGHNGLRIIVERPDADPAVVEATASLVRRHSNGELDDQEYFTEVQRTVRTPSG